MKTTKQARFEPLAGAVKEVFWRHRRRDASRRLHAELAAEGRTIDRHKIRRLMKEGQPRVLTGKSFVPQTTDSRQ